MQFIQISAKIPKLIHALFISKWHCETTFDWGPGVALGPLWLRPWKLATYKLHH